VIHVKKTQAVMQRNNYVTLQLRVKSNGEGVN